MLRQAGQGHDPLGVNRTQPGELAVQCHACPQPDINLPEDWQLALDSEQWLYNLLLSQDVSFKQKGRTQLNDTKDLPFGNGWSMFVNSVQYTKFLSMEVCTSRLSFLVY